MEVTLESISAELLLKYPLIKEGYDVLECIHCETTCYPTDKLSNGTVKYNRHTCIPKIAGVVMDGWKKRRNFSINIDGDFLYPQYY